MEKASISKEMKRRRKRKLQKLNKNQRSLKQS
jgi:hypothetical protein